VDKTSGGTVTQTRTYYPAAGAMRVGSTLYYVLKDQLGSASVVTDATVNALTVGEERYYPFGETRFSTGTMYTDKLFTGQRDTGLGIYYFNARFYSPKLGRFISADSIVPGVENPQDLNRFAYGLNNPLRYIDPTGNVSCSGANWDDGPQCSGTQEFKQNAPKDKLAYKIHKKYRNISIQDSYKWELSQLSKLEQALDDIYSKGFSNSDKAFNAAFGDITFVHVLSGSLGYQGIHPNLAITDYPPDGIIKATPGAYYSTFIHEMGHVFDSDLKRINGAIPSYSRRYANVFDSGSGATGYGRTNSYEDFADSFLAVIKYGSQTKKVDQPRINTIIALMQSYTNSDHTLHPGR